MKRHLCEGVATVAILLFIGVFATEWLPRAVDDIKRLPTLRTPPPGLTSTERRDFMCDDMIRSANEKCEEARGHQEQVRTDLHRGSESVRNGFPHGARQ